MGGGCLGRADGNVRGISRRVHEPHRGTRVEMQDLRSIGECLEESRALLEPVDRRENLADRSQRCVTDPAQAVIDARRLLTDDRHLGLAEQIVGLVDASRGGVLDWQDGEVNFPRLQGVNSGLVRAGHDHLAVDISGGEVFLRREVAKGVLAAHRDANRHLSSQA